MGSFALPAHFQALQWTWPILALVGIVAMQWAVRLFNRFFCGSTTSNDAPTMNALLEIPSLGPSKPSANPFAAPLAGATTRAEAQRMLVAQPGYIKCVVISLLHLYLWAVALFGQELATGVAWELGLPDLRLPVIVISGGLFSYIALGILLQRFVLPANDWRCAVTIQFLESPVLLLVWVVLAVDFDPVLSAVFPFR